MGCLKANIFSHIQPQSFSTTCVLHCLLYDSYYLIACPCMLVWRFFLLPVNAEMMVLAMSPRALLDWGENCCCWLNWFWGTNWGWDPNWFWVTNWVWGTNWVCWTNWFWFWGPNWVWNWLDWGNCVCTNCCPFWTNCCPVWMNCCPFCASCCPFCKNCCPFCMKLFPLGVNWLVTACTIGLPFCVSWFGTFWINCPGFDWNWLKLDWAA